MQSIVDQTYSNLEIILVDDGSPDNCPSMCDTWAEKDSRIRVIHKENGGLSDARNAGMKVANGQFIAFVDSDDWVDLNLYRTLLDAIKRTDSDIACCKVVKVWDNGIENATAINDKVYEIFDKQKGLFELISDRKIQQVVWNKLYKKSVVSDIWFEVGKYHEDEFWTYQVLGKANQTVVVDCEGYFYLQRNSSIMGTAYSIKRLDAIDAKVYRQEYLLSYFPTLVTIGKKNLLYTCLYHGQLVSKYIKASEKKAAMIRLKKVFEHYGFKDEESGQIPFKDRMWLDIGKRNFKLTCYLRNLLRIGC